MSYSDKFGKEATVSSPSPRSHLNRLGILLAAGFIVFLFVKGWATPSSWDYEKWYRADSLEEMKQQPLVYGGNESCEECHEDEYEEALEFDHKTLSCESCHGALADHVKDGKKSANAIVDDKSNWQCMNCHDKLINRPKDYPQFSKEKIRRHKEMKEGILCLKCHDAHDPTI